MLSCQRRLFDIPEDVAYLNCAYMSPLMSSVVEAGTRGLLAKARPWNIGPRDFFTTSDRLRDAWARIIGARARDIAIIPAASYGIASAARNLPLERGQKILLLEEQFPSNHYPWRARAREAGAELTIVPRPPDGRWTEAVLDALDDTTAIAALPHCHWTDGGLLDLERIGEACRDRGIRLVVDATQTAGVLPLDVKKIRPDFLTAAAYKYLMGPYSMAFLYVAEPWQNGTPIEHSWVHRANAENFAGLVDYTDEFQPGAIRFDVGERSNFALVPAAEAAARQILGWGVANIAEAISAMTRQLSEAVSSLGLEPTSPDLRAGHYLCLRLPKNAPPNLIELLARRKIFVSMRGSSLRATPHLYNTPKDLDRFIRALETTLIR